MRAFERDGTRFEVELDGASIVTRTIVGDEISTTEIVDFDNVLRAKWDADRMCSAKEAEGYERVPGGDLFELHDSDFERALHDDPDDVGTYVVYGDWLAERGDAWGQLITVQHALANLPRFGHAARRDELEREEVRLLFRHASRLWGWLGETIVDENTQRYACDVFESIWFRGFLREVRVRQLRREGPASFPEMVDALAGLPIAALLRGLLLTDDEPAPEHLASLGRHDWPHLNRLEVRNEFGFTYTAELFDAGPLAPLLAERTPSLESLVIIGATNLAPVCRALTRSAAAPRLRSIAIERSDWSEAAVAPLIAGAFPKLEDLLVSGTGLPTDARERLVGAATHVRVDIREDP